ncbi:MAG: hypothetical protein GWQ05_07215 [Verrucomicrobiaceae bacterium]|nr:hypothetical protein [Verrucomicrobiaceae bacterium]NCF90735.1 hypothetical protein [Verrucomicrobiaceae bacterium]
MIIPVRNYNRERVWPRHDVYNDEYHKIGDDVGGVSLRDTDMGYELC